MRRRAVIFVTLTIVALSPLISHRQRSPSDNDRTISATAKPTEFATRTLHRSASSSIYLLQRTG